MSGFAVTCIDPLFDLMHLRWGALPGEGKVIKFETEKDAESAIQNLKFGMEAGVDYLSFQVIPYRDDFPEFDEDGQKRMVKK